MYTIIFGQNLIWWLVQFSNVLLSFVMIYLITHAAMKKKILLNYRHIALIVAGTAVVAPLYLVDLYVLQAAGILITLLMVKYVSWRSFSDSVIIYGLSLAIVIVIQAPIFGIFWLGHEFLDFSWPFTFLSVQLITVFAVALVCKKFKLNQLLNTLLINIFVKCMVLLAVLLILVIIASITLEYQFTFFLFYALAILVVVAALYPVLVKLNEINISVNALPELRKRMIKTMHEIQNMDDAKEVEAAFMQILKDFGVDLGSFEDVPDNLSGKINHFIKRKLVINKSNVEVISDNIDCEILHSNIDILTVLNWLGALLDNAIESSYKRPIIIDFSSSEDKFVLKVSNEYIGEAENIKYIFEHGYNKYEAGQNVGLHALYKKVTELGGTVEATTMHMEEYNCRYLTVCIEFSFSSDTPI